MRENEFSSAGQEFAPTGAEFGPTGREFSCIGAEQVVLKGEFEQKNGGAPERKRKRRVPSLMLTAAAVVTAVVCLSAGPTGFPQPENFCEAYQEYMDEMMAACAAEDELALHQLASSHTATEFWQQCMEPYYQLLRDKGYSNLVYYDGAQMTCEPGAVPVLWFQHWEATEEEMLEHSLAGMRGTDVGYFQDGSQIEQGGAGTGMYYTSSYDGYYFDEQGRQVASAPSVRCFFGTLSKNSFQRGQDIYVYLTLIEGVYREYNQYGYTGDTAQTMRLDRTMEGIFVRPSEETYVTYLENGILRYYFDEHGVTEAVVKDGYLQLNDSITIEWCPNISGQYDLTVYSPDGAEGHGYGGIARSDQLEENLYHTSLTAAHW